MKRRSRRPIIQLHRRYRPKWVAVFTWAILLAWPTYACYVYFVYPAIHGHTYFEDWVEENYPELDVFDRRGSRPSEAENSSTLDHYDRDATDGTSMILGPTDLEILEAFALRIGPMLPEQFAQWRSIALSNARRTLNRLHRAGWLSLVRGGVRLLAIEGPLYAAAPGDPEPDWGTLAHQSRNRYRGVKSRHLSIYSATKKCYQSFGVRKRAPLKPHHLSHDLALTSVFLRLLAAKPDVSSQWRPEDLYAASCEHGRKVPDVLLVDPETNLPIKGIDFLGPSYGADRLRDLSHELLNIRRIPVELY